MNRTSTSFSSRLASSRTAAPLWHAAFLALGLLFPIACKKDGKGTEKPGGVSAQDVEAQVAKAKQDAKVAGLIEIANEDLKNGRYVSAAKRAEEALEENPDNADAYAVLGAALWREGEYLPSTEAFQKAVDLEPTNYGAVLGLARNLQAVGQHAEAAELQDRLIAEDKEQIDPYLAKLWSYYALADAQNGVKVLDEIFQRLPSDDPILPLVQSYQAFLRPLAEKGPLLTVEGKTGTSDAGIDHNVGMKYSSAVIGGEFARAIFFENREESIVDADLAKKLGLKEVGKVKPLGMAEELGIVVVPEIKFGDLSLKNVPALVQSLEPYEQAMGERPGVILGRQAMHAMGSITFDFPARSLTVTKDAPASAPADEIESPFLLLSMHVQNAPAVPLKIDGSDHEFWAYFGNIYKSGVAVTQKHYFKSGHLPREVDPPDDPAAGLKMVYLDEVALAGTKLPGMGGLVLVNNPPDQNLGTLLTNTGFELGGYVNLAVMETWKVTYSLPKGKVYVKVPG